MSVTAAIRRMLEAGLTIEQALTAAEAFEAAQQPVEPELTKRQARNKRYYERLKASENRLNTSEQDVSDEITPAPSPSPLGPPSQTLPPIIPQSSSPTPEKKRATRLSPDWLLPASWGEWAKREGHLEATIRLEADKFRDFWCSKSGKDATKLDWFATWRNWMRNVRNAPRGHAPPGQPKKPTLATMWHDDAKRIGLIEDEPASSKTGLFDDSDGSGRNQVLDLSVVPPRS